MSGGRPILAIDLGTQSLRVTAVDPGGRRLWSWSRPVATFIDGLVAEQDPAEWSELLHAGLREASAAGIVPAGIAACGVLAGFVAVDVDGQALTRAVMYNDGRAAPVVAEVEATLGAGNSWPRAAAADPLPQWLRLRREAPDIAAATIRFLDATGWLNHALTGAASLNPYTGIRLFTPAIRSALGVADAAIFGPVVPTGARVGSLRPGLAAALGWPAVPVFSAPFDSKCAYLASGIATPGSGLDISGTVTSFGVVSARAILDPERRIYTVPLGERWLVRGSTAAAGSILEWAKRLLGTDFERMDDLVAATPPGAGGVTLVPYHSGARAPLWQPEARGLFAGLSLETGQAEIARSVYESLAFSLNHIVGTIEACGAPVADIRLSGGLSRNRILSQMKADVTGKPVVALSETELTTAGLVAIAAVGLGLHPDLAAASRVLVSDGERFAPSPGHPYAAAYARYLDAASVAAPSPQATATDTVPERPLPRRRQETRRRSGVSGPRPSLTKPSQRKETTP